MQWFATALVGSSQQQDKTDTKSEGSQEHRLVADINSSKSEAHGTRSENAIHIKNMTWVLVLRRGWC